MSPDPFDGRRALVATPHADISYVDVGTGPTALFVHGVGTNALLWRNVIEQVAGARRCIALDLPLHGGSPARADQDFTLGGLADVIEEFCAALELSSVDLVAHDTGGALAQIFAARHPERLRSFVLTNCDTHDNVPPAPARRRP
jgi:pimeloyl-ACP methyl ester carboxylesterase